MIYLEINDKIFEGYFDNNRIVIKPSNKFPIRESDYEFFINEIYEGHKIETPIYKKDIKYSLPITNTYKRLAIGCFVSEVGLDGINRDIILSFDQKNKVINELSIYDKSFDSQQAELQFEKDKTIDIVGNCANCGVEYHIHKDVNEIQATDEVEVLIKAFAEINQIFNSRRWILDGRGNYEFDDEGYKNEVNNIFDEFKNIKEQMWSNIKSKTADYREKILKNNLEEIMDDEINHFKYMKKIRDFDNWKFNHSLMLLGYEKREPRYL